MNKILMDKKVINLLKEEDLKLSVDSNEDIEINLFSSNAKDVNIDFSCNDNNKIIINYSGVVNSDTKININGKVNGSNNKCYLYIRCIAKNGSAYINALVKANENTNNNDIIEDIKGVNDGGMVTILPILEIDTNEVLASHFATIGGYDKDELFYLESKGVSIKNSKELLKNKFIFSIFSEEYKKMIGKEEKHE